MCQFSFVPSGLFSRLIVRVMSLWKNGTFDVVWAYGIILRGLNSDAFIEYFPAEFRIEIYVAGKESTRYLRLFLEQIEQIVGETFSDQNREYTKHALCPHCISNPSVVDVYNFPLEKCYEAISSKKPFVLCRGWFPVPLDDVVPDLSLSDVPQIDPSKVHKITCIGKGGFGEVWKGELTDTKQVVAIKTLLTDESKDLSGTDLYLNFCKEVVLMSLLNHPNIVALLYVTLFPSASLITEFVSGGDLYHYMQKMKGEGQKPNMLFSWRVASDIAAGMNYLHTRFPPIIHRDLKSPNILLVSSDPEQPGPLAKVADFGIAGTVASFAQKGGGDEFSYWQPPEILNRQTYSLSADVYSFGIIMSEILTFNQPFEGQLETYNTFFKVRNAITRGLRPSLPTDLHPQLNELINSCWSGDWQQRPTFSDVLHTLWNLREELLGIQVPTSDTPATPRTLASSGTASSSSEPSLPTLKLDRGESLRLPQAFPVGTASASGAASKSMQSGYTCVFSHEGLLWVGTFTGRVIVFEGKEGHSISTSHTGPVSSITDLPGSVPPQLVSACTSGILCIIDLQTRKVKKVIKTDSTKTQLPSFVFSTLGNTYVLRGKALSTLSPLGVLQPGFELYLTEIDTRQLRPPPKAAIPKEMHHQLLSLAPKGSLFISAMLLTGSNILWLGVSSGMLVRFDLQSSRRMERSQAHEEAITSIVALDDNIWTSSSAGTVRLFHSQSARFLESVEVPNSNPILALAASNVYVVGLSPTSLFFWNKWSRKTVQIITTAYEPTFATYLPALEQLWVFGLDATFTIFRTPQLPQHQLFAAPPASPSLSIVPSFESAPSLILKGPAALTTASYSPSSSPLAHAVGFSTLENNRDSNDAYSCVMWRRGGYFCLADGNVSGVAHPNPLAADFEAMALGPVRQSRTPAEVATAFAQHFDFCSRNAPNLALTMGTISPISGVPEPGSHLLLLRASPSVKAYLRSAAHGRVAMLQTTAESPFVTAVLCPGDMVILLTDGIYRNFNAESILQEEDAISELTGDSLELHPFDICETFLRFTLDTTCFTRRLASQKQDLPADRSYLDHASIVVVRTPDR